MAHQPKTWITRADLQWKRLSGHAASHMHYKTQLFCTLIDYLGIWAPILNVSVKPPVLNSQGHCSRCSSSATWLRKFHWLLSCSSPCISTVLLWTESGKKKKLKKNTTLANKHLYKKSNFFKMHRTFSKALFQEKPEWSQGRPEWAGRAVEKEFNGKISTPLYSHQEHVLGLLVSETFVQSCLRAG